MSTDPTPVGLDLDRIRTAVQDSAPPGWARGELAWRRDVTALIAEVERLRQQVVDVRAMHAPFVKAAEHWCQGCSAEDGQRYHWLEPWPCATIKAINGEVEP
jgi:hypothetical protein